MSARLARLAAATVLAAGVVTFGFAAPAQAEGEVAVNMGSLGSQMDAGDGENFTVRLSNRTDEEYRGVRVVFTVRMDGLEATHVRITNEFGPLNRQAAGNGEVRLFDVGRFLNRDNRPLSQLTVRYRIEFSDSAPGGQAEIGAAAIFRNQVFGSDQDQMRIRGGEPTQTTEATQTTGPRSERPGPSLAAVPPATPVAASPVGGGPPMILYILGALLVIAGSAMLWLLFRRPRPALVGGAPTLYPAGPYPAGPYDTGPIGGAGRLSHPVYPPPTGPPPRRSTPPTAAMPTVNPTYAPQHSAVDPWADSAEDPFPR